MTDKNTSLITAAITGVIGVLVGGFGAGVYYNKAQDAQLSSDQQKQSYSLGIIMGTQIEPALAMSKDRISTDYFIQGLRDKIDKKEVKLTEKEIQANLKSLQEDAVSKIKQEVQEKAVAKQKDLFDNGNVPYHGDGDIAIVEFFDYNCPHCRTLSTELSKLVADNKNVKVLFRPVGLVSQNSQMAALAVLAANKQNKFKEFHTALMSVEGEVNEKALDKIIEDTKIDKKQFEKDFVSEEVSKQAQQNRKIFIDLGLRGVPSVFAAKMNDSSSIADQNLIYLSGADTKSLNDVLDKLNK